MQRLIRTGVPVLAAILLFARPSFAQVDIWTIGVDNTRQGWNKSETTLTPKNVPKLRKLREFMVDEKIDVSPLVVGNKLYVFTMSNTAFVFDVTTGAQLATRQLAPPFDPRPDPGQMDRWLLYKVAFDVRGLNREAGFAPTPAVWNVTPGGGAGGVWMSGSGPAIDGNDIYLATGNGMDPGTLPGNFGESFVKLRYTAAVAGVDEGRPKLVVADHWGAR